MDSKHVFISYKADEFDQALAVMKHLEANGITCWMAPMSIRGGSSYAQEIPPAIRDSSIFVLILSELAQQSKWVPRELDQAINCGKVVMPYMLENCPLRDDFSFYLTNVQHYEAFRNPEETLAQMTRDIQALLGITPPPQEEDVPVIPEPVPPKEPKPAKIKAKKRPTGKKKKKTLPLIIAGAVLAAALVLVLLRPEKVKIGDASFDAATFSVRLENVTLTQQDVDAFSKLQDVGIIELVNCTIEAQDLGPMSAEKLVRLELKNCSITDAQFSTLDFSGNHYFSALSVSGNAGLTTIPGPDAYADTLTELDISNTGIRSFDWLQGFTKLQVLRADRTGLQAGALLESMIYLEELSLSGNGILSLEGLQNTSKLSKVDLSHNSITDVSVLSYSVSCLTELHLEHNALSDLNCLSGAAALRKVYVDANELSDLLWLKGSPELRLLSASQNRISSLSELGIGAKLLYLNLSDNQLQAIASGELIFEADGALMVDLRNNRLQTLQLPENCTYKQLVLLGNPDLDLTSLHTVKGWDLYFDFPAEVSLQTLKDLPFSRLCIVGCPLNRQVEVEEGLSTEELMSEADALQEIAQKTENANY